MLIQCDHLTKTYPADGYALRAVDNVSLRVEAGDFVIILGHSGSGKTTLLSLIGGLTSPDSGAVQIKGRDNGSLDDRSLSALRNQTIGFIFQFASLLPALTNLENVLLPLRFGGKPGIGRNEGLDLLDRVGLADRANSFPGQLSGGQQRRIAIARAFINRPDIILADEPTGDLDEDTESEIFTLFSEFNREGITFVVVTHNREFGAGQESLRTLHMKGGRIPDARAEDNNGRTFTDSSGSYHC